MGTTIFTPSGTISNKCLVCKYLGTNVKACDYILIERKRRGCPAGDECTRCSPRRGVSELLLQVRFNDSFSRRLPRDEGFLALYHEGLSDSLIASAMGVSEVTIRTWRRRFNLPSNSALKKECET